MQFIFYSILEQNGLKTFWRSFLQSLNTVKVATTLIACLLLALARIHCYYTDLKPYCLAQFNCKASEEWLIVGLCVTIRTNIKVSTILQLLWSSTPHGTYQENISGMEIKNDLPEFISTQFVERERSRITNFRAYFWPCIFCLIITSFCIQKLHFQL